MDDDDSCPSCEGKAVNVCDVDLCCNACQEKYYATHENFSDRFDVGYDYNGPYLIDTKTGDRVNKET